MKLTTAEIFQDNMILQRGVPVRIWGNTAPGTKVTVSIQSSQCMVTSDPDGYFEAQIPALEASVCEELVVSSGNEKLIFQNVAVGEVWLAGGQSNMEFQMLYDKEYEVFSEICENRLIRMYDVARIASDYHKEKFDYSLYNYWRTASCDELKYFSAVAYYFARHLQDDLKVPVGIINCSWGGTRSACWMDRESLLSAGKVWLDDYETGLAAIEDPEAARQEYFSSNLTDPADPFGNEIRNRLMKGMTQEELDSLKSMFEDNSIGAAIGDWHEWRPNALYEYMLKTVMPYTIRGAIYYQGESDCDHPQIYSEMLRALVLCWRQGFKENFPFLMTQLAPLDGEEGAEYPELRRQQERAASMIPDVWCASIGDVGNIFDIHPKEKRPVGERLALLARKHVYGESILADAPVGISLERQENSLIIKCENVQGGLIMKEGRTPLIIRDHSGAIVEQTDYDLEINKDSLFIKFNILLQKTPYEVQFASSAYYKVNLYNMSEIPMKPFILKEKEHDNKADMNRNSII